MLVLLVFRLVLRHDRLAAIAFMVLLGLPASIQSPLAFAPALVLNVLGVGAPLYVVVRQGCW